MCARRLPVRETIATARKPKSSPLKAGALAAHKARPSSKAGWVGALDASSDKICPLAERAPSDEEAAALWRWCDL